MKKYTLTALALAFANIAIAQTNILNVQDTRAVATSPSSYSQSVEAHFKAGSVLGLPNTYYTVLGLRGWADDSGGKAYELTFSEEGKVHLRSGYSGAGWSNWRSLLVSDDNGNVGIGTATPKAKLDLTGNMYLQSALHNSSPRPSLSIQPIGGEIRSYSQLGYGADDGFLRLGAGAGTSTNTMSYIDISSYSTIPEMNQNIVFGTAGEEKMRIAQNGNVGIGTATPNEKLAVNGKIRAHEIKIETANWPDYVFEEGYKVGTLEELEGYIKINKRLPEMPSAKEVEANGVELGELVKLQQKKIEELTLYLIEQNKQQQDLLTQVKLQQQEIEKLKLSKDKSDE